MSKKRRNPTDFTVLDAIRLAVIPKEHRISAIAAYLIVQGDGVPTPILEARKVASLLAEAGSEADLVDKIIAEVHRQLQIKIRRIDCRRRIKNAAALGSQLEMPIRVNRLCRRLFGDPKSWVPAGPITPTIRDAHFNWLHRSLEGTLVAGFDGSRHQVDELITGFVYRDKGGPVRFVRLPAQARTLQDLYSLLGLPRMLKSSAKIDWQRRAFIVSKTNRLPWVYH